MKRALLILTFLSLTVLVYGQDSYSVNGEILELKTEVEGTLDLLWTIDNGNYRYFVRKSNSNIVELKNNKTSGNNYDEVYKTTLYEISNGTSANDVKLTLYSLKNYIDAYNASVDKSYIVTIENTDPKIRLGIFGGITNNPFIGNVENVQVPQIAAELEILGASNRPRHSGFLQGKQTFSADDFEYSTTEISLGYRYRIISKAKFSIFGQLKISTVNFSKVTFIDEDDNEVNLNETSFDIPIILGVGTDIKIGDNGYITFIYGELFAVFLDNQDNFSTDFLIGYKFNL